MIDQEIDDLRDKWAKDYEIAVVSAKRDGLETPPEPDDAADEHPYLVYMSGVSRWDLKAEELAPYIDFEASPEIWRVRRLSFDLRQEVNHLLRSGRDEEANWKSFLNGVMGLEGATDEEGEKLAKVIADLPAKRLAPKKIKALRDAVSGYAMGAVRDVGMAVYQGSMDLTEAEGKPSASPPGE